MIQSGFSRVVVGTEQGLNGKSIRAQWGLPKEPVGAQKGNNSGGRATTMTRSEQALSQRFQ
eukprot:5325408-Alexandrium_andersonii.AAC.1